MKILAAIVAAIILTAITYIALVVRRESKKVADARPGAIDAPAEPPATFTGPLPPLTKVEFHLDRYDRAIEQCRKGPERMEQLQRDRAEWAKLKEYYDLKGAE